MTTAIHSQAFDDLAARVLDERWQVYPHEAASSGLHEYDGRLPVVSQQAIDTRVAQLRSTLAEAEAIDGATLFDQQRFDLALLTNGVRHELLELTELRQYRRDPQAHLYPIDVSNYMDRDYAPVGQRLEAVARLLRGVPAYLDAARGLLAPPFAKPVLSAGIEAWQGMAGFYGDDLAMFAEQHATGALAQELADARNAAISSLNAFVDYLKSQQATANDDFALGAEHYAAMLRYGEMVDVPLADIEAAGERELARLDEIAGDAAERIALGQDVHSAVSTVSKEHPTADRLLDDTRAMLEEIRTFVVDRDIASVISEVRPTVRETPAFMRWAFAAMSGPGPFEQVATESFYYVTPVDPQWTPEQAEEWLSNFNYANLKMISVHEVYPGHYVHFLRHHNAPSPISKVFGAYSFWEGWAHYCEEMMLEQGYGVGDPMLQLAMAHEALIRLCRLMCSLRMHTRGMTLAEAKSFFQEHAYMEELPASKEAQRGTFDPGYLNYTLGKLMIYKLRADVQREQGSAFSLKAFHDELLSHGGPPVPLLRGIMLRHDDGKVL